MHRSICAVVDRLLCSDAGYYLDAGKMHDTLCSYPGLPLKTFMGAAFSTTAEVVPRKWEEIAGKVSSTIQCQQN